jgi:beta-1,4-N-acetylglucosaminyltransferase
MQSIRGDYKMILVTVGTTPFDSLIQFIDELEDIDEEIILQISKDAKYIPVNKKYFEFISNINEYYENASLIITHAGAGSIYNLLELNKRIIIVPNTERVDNHQLDITEYMKNEKYALTCTEINSLSEILKNLNSYEIKKYTKRDFFKTDEITNTINSLYKI